MHKEPIIIEIPAADKWTWEDLMHTCKKHKVKGYTKMNKAQLIEAVKVILNRHNE